MVANLEIKRARISGAKTDSADELRSFQVQYRVYTIHYHQSFNVYRQPTQGT